MAVLSTGPIDNSPVLGIRPTRTITLKIVNRSASNLSGVVIQGFVLGAFRMMYVNEVLDIGANGVLTRNYFADLDSFEFEVVVTEVPEEDIGISVWGKQESGGLIEAHRIVTREMQDEV